MVLAEKRLKMHKIVKANSSGLEFKDDLFKIQNMCLDVHSEVWCMATNTIATSGLLFR